MRLSLCSARLWEYFTGLRRSYDAGWAAVWWNLPFGSPWADFECRYAYRYIQISAPLDHPWKYPSTLLPTFFRKCSWFSEKFTVCSWRFSLLHSFNTGFLLMMMAILEGGFLENGIAFWGKVWYNNEAVRWGERWENAHDSLKSLQFVHDDSPSCIVGARDFCWWWRGFQRVDFLKMGLHFRGQYAIMNM